MPNTLANQSLAGIFKSYPAIHGDRQMISPRLVLAVRVGRCELEDGRTITFDCANQPEAIKFLMVCFPGAVFELIGTDKIKIWGMRK